MSIIQTDDQGSNQFLLLQFVIGLATNIYYQNYWVNLTSLSEMNFKNTTDLEGSNTFAMGELKQNTITKYQLIETILGNTENRLIG